MIAVVVVVGVDVAASGADVIVALVCAGYEVVVVGWMLMSFFIL